jgi:imidazole glycerol phosphate synthase subunit HisF
MRVGACVLLKDGQCYQSYGWQQFRPLGGLQHVVDMLEAYHIDEIAIIRPIRDHVDKDSLLSDMQHLQDLKTMTPISFGGGVRSRADLDALPNLPIERLVFSSAYIQKNESLIKAATASYGRQALQALLPVAVRNNELFVFHCQQNNWEPLTEDCLQYCAEHANEIIFYDTANEGIRDAFDWALLESIMLNSSQLILSGGIGEETTHLALRQGFASVLVENRILHQEYSVRRYKHG